MKKLLSILFLSLIVNYSFAQVKVNSEGDIIPTGIYPAVKSTNLKGTIHQFKSIVDRNALPTNFRDTGMIAYVRDSAKYYYLYNGITNADWRDLFKASSALIGDIDVLQNTIDSSSFGIKKLDGTVKNVVVYADGLTGFSGGGTQVNSDWNATSGVAAILNKPTLFSGSYTDLTSKPTLFSGSYTDLTNKPTLFSGSYLDLSNKPTIPAQFNPIAGTNMTITGTYPNITFNSTASGGGTVTQFNFTNSTGITGTVANTTTTPTLSLVIDTSAISSFSTKVRSLFNATSPIVYNNGNISLDTTVVHTSAYNNATYQGKLTLTTTGTSGTATLIGNTLNIPQYSGGTYTLPTASATVLGGIKVGSGLAIDGSGVLSATGGGGTYTASNGLTMSGSDVQWGGTVTQQILLYSDNYGLNFGNNYWANSGQSFSFGDYTQATNGGFAANRNSHAIGMYSTALNGANAYGDYSFAAGGSRTTGLGTYGVAFGLQNYVNSYTSFATGFNDTTNASYSSVLGSQLNSKYSYGTVIGKWNNRSDPVYGDYPDTQRHNPVDKVFQIGIGDSSLNPKNALDVYWSGRMRFTQYGSGTFIPGIYSMTAPTHSLQVDSQGNIIEGNLISAIGTATLSSGTVVVNSTLVKSTSKIFITVNTPSGTQGITSVPPASIIEGTSFVINSSSATDNSTLNWIIIN